MSDWKPKRFWKSAEVVSADGGYTVALDGRGIKTPAKAALVVPTKAMAEAIAAEWDAQEKEVDPETMPVTRSANAAIDKVTAQRREIVDLIAEYGGSDLICYRAEAPAELVERQARAWDPLLDFAARELRAPLEKTTGIVHRAQPADSLVALHRRVSDLSAFQLAAFNDLVSLSGSLVIGFAVAARYAPAESLWLMSRIDELWQEEQWGADEEATKAATIKREAFLQAERFFFIASW